MIRLIHLVFLFFLISCNTDIPSEFKLKSLETTYCHPYDFEVFSFKRFNVKSLESISQSCVCNSKEYFSEVLKNEQKTNRFLTEGGYLSECSNVNFQEHYYYYCYQKIKNKEGELDEYYKKIILIDTISKTIYKLVYDGYHW